MKHHFSNDTLAVLGLIGLGILGVLALVVLRALGHEPGEGPMSLATGAAGALAGYVARGSGTGHHPSPPPPTE